MTTRQSVVAYIFKEFADNLGIFLTENFITFNPQALIICGNIAKAAALFLPHLKITLNYLPIELVTLGEDAALLGAASLFTMDKTIVA